MTGPCTHPGGSVQEGGGGGGRSALSPAGVSAARAAGHRLGHPQEQSAIVAFLFVVQTYIRYLVRNEMSDLGEKPIP